MATSNKYLTMLKCNEGSGLNVPDSSGQGNTGLFGAGNTTAWDNAEAFTSTAAVSQGGMYIADTTMPFDPWNGDSIIYMLYMKRDNSTATDQEHGNNRLAASTGFVFNTQATRRFGMTARLTAASKTMLSRYNVSDNLWHHVAFVMDGPTRTMSIYIDGVLGDGPSGTFINGGGVGVHITSVLTASMQSTQSFGWGSVANSTNTAFNLAGQWKGIHILRYAAQSLPANVYAIVQAGMLDPFTPLDASIAG